MVFELAGKVSIERIRIAGERRRRAKDYVCTSVFLQQGFSLSSNLYLPL